MMYNPESNFEILLSVANTRVKGIYNTSTEAATAKLALACALRAANMDDDFEKIEVAKRWLEEATRAFDELLKEEVETFKKKLLRQ